MIGALKIVAWSAFFDSLVDAREHIERYMTILSS